jgi:hypothetical protein
MEVRMTRGSRSVFVCTAWREKSLLALQQGLVQLGGQRGMQAFILLRQKVCGSCGTVALSL